MGAQTLTRFRHLTMSCFLLLVPIIAFATTDDGTITVGSSGTTGVCTYGYISAGHGAYSPTGLTGGETVVDLYDLYTGITCGTPTGSGLGINGFPSNPGQSWLTSVTCNGVTKTGATATYSYSSGSAGWSWSGTTTFGFIGKRGSQLGCAIVHN